MSALAGSCGECEFSVRRHCQTIFQSDWTIEDFHSVWEIQFLCILINTYYCQNFFKLFLFGVALGPLCWVQAFFSCREWGLLSSCGALASRRGGFSLQITGSRTCWLQSLQQMGSRANGPQKLWFVGLVVLWHMGSSQTRDWTRVPGTGRKILNH